ncbi:MAG: helicase-exonuclease AddAB subunit AddA [Clostridiales bacterium]|nr:helicase-exonuclease AddAB subunit AddA [Clostridiales bacterium]
MAVSFSTKQQQAIDWDDNQELLISAAAGSGKTTVLTARIIDRITNKHIPIDRFFVVTFTHMAADDLKERITRAISDKIKEDPNNSFLQLQLANVATASIGTMHSFCLKVLKEFHEHPSVMLPKSVKILNEEKGEQMLEEACREVFAEEYENDEDSFRELLDTYASFRGDDDVRDHVKRIYKFALNNESPYEWLDDIAKGKKTSDIEREMYCGIYKIIALEAIDMCDNVLDNFVPQKSSVNYPDQVALVRQDLKKYVEAIDNSDFAGAQKILSSIDYIRLVGGKVKDEAVLAYKNLLKYVNTTVLGQLKLDIDEISKDDISGKYVKTMASLAIRVGTLFEEKKRKAKCIDYSDMEHMVLELFKDESVAGIYSSKFDHIMFDEYQDCNLLQEKIVKRVSGNAKYFMVGDIKQSIYSFRQAEPKLFLSKYLSYEYRQDAPLAVIELNENYRSRQNVLNATNRVFFNVMQKEFCGMTYDSQNALNAMASYPVKDGSTFESDPVKIALITGKNLDKTQKSRAQLLYIIDSIRTMMNNKSVYDAKSGEYRPLHYSDIAILMRSPKSEIPLIKECFSFTEIPISIMQDADIRYQPEVNLLMCLIRCIENPYNDMDLMTVLRSYIFGVSDSQLAVLNAFGEKNIPLITKLNDYIEADDHNEELAKKLVEFNSTYKLWVERSFYSNAQDFVDELIDEIAYLEYFSAQQDGISKKSNIERLLSALKLSAGEDASLYDYVTALQNIDEKGLNASTNLAVDDSVSIMSMHKSKGLEFPVVFLMDMHNRFSDEDTKSEILIHKDYGIASLFIDTEYRIKYKTANYELMKALINKQKLEEEQRILYVAMTRAKEQLIIVGYASSETVEKNVYIGKKIAYISDAGNYLDWMLYSLCCDNYSYVSPGSVKSDLGYSFRLCADSKTLYPSLWSVEVFDYNGYQLTSPYNTVLGTALRAQKRPLSSMDEAEAVIISSLDTESLIKKLSFEYPYKQSTTVSSKLSVTQIKRLLEKTDEEYVPDYRTESVKRVQNPSGITAARLGSLYHFFMQHAQIKTPYTAVDFDNDIERMLERRLITSNEAKSLDVKKILPFFNCLMGERISRAAKIKREMNFSYLIDANTIYPEVTEDVKILMQGVADLVFEDENGINVLVDYKTDSVSAGNESLLIKRHSSQVNLYKRAIEDIDGIRIQEVYIYSFALNKFIKMY